MSNEEKILALLEKQDIRFEKIEAQLAEQGKQLAEQGKQLAEQGEQLAEQGKQLAEQGKQLTEQGKQLAEQSEQLAEQGERLRKIEMTQENRILPSLRVLAEGHSDILNQFAKKESVAEARGTANFALSLIKDHTEKISDLTDRVGALEKAN